MRENAGGIQERRRELRKNAVKNLKRENIELTLPVRRPAAAW
jgi:hypothetical protein